MPAPVRRVLFVCTGNLCRSPLAEALFEQLAARVGLAVAAGSAGLYASAGGGAPREARDLARAEGLDLAAHAARPVTREAVENADLVLAAEASHADALRATYPAAADKVRLLSEFATPAHRGRDVGDPYGRTPGHYRTSFEEIRECVEGLVRALGRAA